MSGDHNDYHMKVWGNWMSDEFDRRDNLQKLTDHDNDLRFTKDETNELIEALEEALYLLNPTDEDMQKKAGIYRIVKSLEKHRPDMHRNTMQIEGEVNQ